MLVINFKGQSMDLTLKLPVLGSARPLDTRNPKHEPLMLNVDSEGRVIVQGQKVEIEKYIAREARLLREQLRMEATKIENNELPVPIIIRADRSAPFHLVNHVLKVCQDEGYRQFSLNAMTREEKK
jgi:biopolymer transport protein ExbD